MSDQDLIKAWLRQAETDLDAGQCEAADVLECHRRYWLQQACEKGIKALGITLWKGHPSQAGQFRGAFLHKHSPIKSLQNEPGMPNSLKLLLRQIEAELTAIDGSGLVLKVDSTTPTHNQADVSYRYPFVGPDGTPIAPADYPDWDAYQGNSVGVAAAIDRFITAVSNRAKSNRPPR